MKISLISPPWTHHCDNDIKQFAKRVGGAYPPLNLAYLAAIAEKEGHTVQIIDGEAEELSIDQVLAIVNKFSPDIIGLTATTPFYHISVLLAERIKQQDKKFLVAIGGAHITVLKEHAFEDCFDYAFIGEAEKSWEQFLDKYEKGSDLSQVGGILYRNKEKEIIDTGPAETVGDINELPLPSRHLLKNELYIAGTMNGDKVFTAMMTTRGCPFNCIFCSTKVFGKSSRRRTPKNVVEEIKECKEKYGTEHIYFMDETFTVNKQHCMEICDLLIKENLGVTLEVCTRANLIDEELVKKMAESGLARLIFGLESVDENIRKIMKKNVPLESYITANRLANKYGIETLNSCMIGMPGETKETIRKTLRFLRETKEIKLANVAIAVPYPGTELYEMVKKGEYGLKLVTDDFSDFQRYNAAVMQVGDLSPQDLIDIQNEAFASIFIFAPWRWEYMIKKSGMKGAELTLKRLEKCIDEGKETNYLTDKQLGIIQGKNQ
jgi:anaerobic magnesium-protoporphyrin IX monomethyl ester cyclase